MWIHTLHIQWIDLATAVDSIDVSVFVDILVEFDKYWIRSKPNNNLMKRQINWTCEYTLIEVYNYLRKWIFLLNVIFFSIAMH